MTKKLKWRLTERPTATEVQGLLRDKIITKEEAREILFTVDDTEERDDDSLQSEIRFLREMVEKLSSNNNTRIIETIREVEKPYGQWPWYDPYRVYCGDTIETGTSSYLNNTSPGASGGTTIIAADAQNFSDIKTF